MYLFTKDKEVQKLIINQTKSGSVCVNDTMMQYAGKWEKGYMLTWWWLAKY